MRKLNLLFVMLLILYGIQWIKANDTLFVKETRIPVLLERYDNVVFRMRFDTQKAKLLNAVTLRFGDETELKNIHSVKLYYSGTEAYQNVIKREFAPVEYISSHKPGKTLTANPSYSILLKEVKNPKKVVQFSVNQPLFPGVNYFWISVRMKSKAAVTSTFTAAITSVEADNNPAVVTIESPKDIVHRVGVGVRHAGNDGSAAFRIPGMVTTLKGTLLGVYDVRYNSSIDLQEHIDIGLSRSTDGGQSWEKMRLPMAFGEYDGLPSAQNGVGDPAILVDELTGTIWLIAVWSHGMGNQRTWWSSNRGTEPASTAQLMLVSSDDDGKTWSKPINITKQVKDPSWHLLLQGPGKGITMLDGTLVFPIQYIDSTRVPNAGIIYSKDHGKIWKINNHARTNTTEAQVAEIEAGVLMLNMRDNRGGSRAVSVTHDLGIHWVEHPSNRSALREPVCMASLINVKAKDNILNRDILLFSNPDTEKGRYNITIKASLDGGITWLPENQLMLDEDPGWGYSCLTMIDNETVGILYESSVAYITFQAVKLKEIINKL